MKFNPWMRGGIFLIFILSTFIFFSRIFFGLDFTDSFFHLNNALYSENNFHPFFFLSSLVIRGVALVFGDELIIFRFMNALFLYLALVLPFLVNKRSFSCYDQLVISVGLLILSPINANILGYDTLSVFMISLCFSFVYKWNFLSTGKLLVLAMLLAASVFVRLPNLIMIFIFGVYLVKVSSLRISFILVLSSLCLILIGYSVFYGSLETLRTALTETEHHKPVALLKGYIKHSFQVLAYGLLITSAFWLWTRLKGKSYAKVIMIFFLFFTLVYTVSFSPYWTGYSLLLTAIGISWCSYRWLFYREKSNDYILLFFLLLFVLPFGSNTGLLKASLGMALFPFLYSSRSINSKTWPVLIFVIIPVAILEYSSMTYEDRAIMQLTKEVNMEKLRGIRTSESRSDFIFELDKKVKYFEKEDYKISFYGDKSHLFKYLYPNSVTADTWKFFQPVEQLSEIEEKIGPKTVLFFIDKYPDAFSLDTRYPLDSTFQTFNLTPHIEQNIRYYTFEEPDS